MSKISQMQGVPSHEEYIKMKENDTKRDRRRCIFYKKEEKRCGAIIDKCIGSAHCPHYKENLTQSKKIEKGTKAAKSKTNKTPIKNYKVSDTEIENLFPVGSYIQHEVFGKGKVNAISSGKITVIFENYGKKIFDTGNFVNDRRIQKIGEIKEELEMCSKKQVFALGDYAGEYELIIYNCKLKEILKESYKSMYIPTKKNKKIPVSVSIDNKRIYVHKSIYSSYEGVFQNSIELKKSIAVKAEDTNKKIKNKKSNHSCLLCGGDLNRSKKWKVGHALYVCLKCNKYFYDGDKKSKMIYRDGTLIQNINS